MTPSLSDFLSSVTPKPPQFVPRAPALMAGPLPEREEANWVLGARVMALTGPGNATATVTEPAGRPDAAVNRLARDGRRW